MIEAFEIDDLDEVDELVALEAEIAEILAAKDVAHLAEAMENGSTAGVIVWENRWAAPFASAARRAGGQLIASGRIPIQAIGARSRPTDERRPKEPDMPLRPRRAVRRAVIAAPWPAPRPPSAPRGRRGASTGGRTAGRTGATLAADPRRARDVRSRARGLVERGP